MAVMSMGEVLRADADTMDALWLYLDRTGLWCVERFNECEPKMLLLSQMLSPYSERDIRLLASQGMAPPRTLLIVDDAIGTARMKEIERALASLTASIVATHEAYSGGSIQ
jgi:hypothetical protein